MPLTRLHQALLFAAKAHSGADREGESPLPYLTHPIEVLNNLRYVGRVEDDEMLCAAILHDVIEESGVGLADIETITSARVADLVRELTRREPSGEEIAGLSRGEIWTKRSEILLAEIAAMSRDAQAIKLADRLSNLREAKRTKRAEKLERYLSQTKRILAIVPESVNPYLWRAVKKEIG